MTRSETKRQILNRRGRGELPQRSRSSCCDQEGELRSPGQTRASAPTQLWAPLTQLREEIAPGAFVLRGFALPAETALLGGLREVTAAAPLRNMVTPGGYRMSVAMTNCGELGWVTDRSGYRYGGVDPESGKKWPAMPGAFRELAERAAAEAGFGEFRPDACLVNRYEPGTKLSLHQDKDERDFTQPIVSVSLGIPAVFLFGGFARGDKTQRVALEHGDVVVWGGAARLRYHGVMTLKDDAHSLLGRMRVNLTFRKAGVSGD